MFFQADYSNANEDEESHVTYGGKEGILYVLDASASMLDENENRQSNFRTALQAIEASMKNLVVSNQRDLVGIIFYNTIHSPKSKFEAESMEIVVPQHTCILLPMDMPSVDNISYVMNFHTSDDLFDFSNKYGCSSDAKFSDVLWFCTRMFQKCGYKLQSSAIVLFTDNPLPHSPNTHEYQQAMVKAKDLCQLNVEFTLIPMLPDFDGKLFYKEFICTAMEMDMDNFEMETGMEDIMTISNRIYRRNYRKRCNNYLKFSLGDNLEMSVGVYSSIRHVKYPKTFHVHRNTNERVTRKRVYEVYNETEDTNITLLPHQQKKYQEIGGRKIIFTTQEVSSMKTILPAGIRLLGFKPRSAILVRHYLKNGCFIYPDESAIAGSTKLFRALWKRCLERQVIPICIMTLRHKSDPGYVALLPQENTFYDQEKTDQIEYNGFHVVHLPNLDDIRDFDSFKPETIVVSEEKTELFKKLVKKLRFRYNPKHFNDPVLKTIYSNIEAFAFKTEGEEHEDDTLPNTDEQDRMIADPLSAITEEFGEMIVTNNKRKNTEPSENARKVSRSTEVDEAKILEAFTKHREDKLTIAELRGYLQEKGVKGISNAKKSVLIDKIREHHNL